MNEEAIDLAQFPAHLRPVIESMQIEIAEMKKRERVMIEKAAANSLEGYRELGRRAAEAERKHDEAQAQLRAVLDVVDKA